MLFGKYPRPYTRERQIKQEIALYIEDATIVYPEVLKVLMDTGYDGYICTEYEGQRNMDIPDVDEIDEVRRQHVMLRRLLGI